MYILGIDIGTSGCKISAFDKDFALAQSVTKDYRTYYGEKGYAQQKPQEWYAAVCEGIGQLGIPLEKVVGIGVDGQGWSCIPIDKNGHVLHDTPIWFDTRAQDQCIQIKKSLEGATIAINSINPSYTTPKVLWFKKNMPDIYRKTQFFLQSNSYIVYKLTGCASQDKSQGYGHYFYDIAKGEYDTDVASAIGIDIDKFPQIFNCHHVIGKVTKKAASELGVMEGTPVVVGGLDAACGTLGAGIIEVNQTQEQGGQAGGMSICLDKPIGHRKLILGNHVIPNLWLLQGGTVGGGASIKWFSQQFGKSFSGEDVFKAMDKEAEKIPIGSDGMIFLPYLAGERSPIWNPKATGVYFGVTFNKTPAHFARATMEGVAYSLLHNLNTAKEVQAKASVLRAMGGSANSRLWTQIKSDVTNCTIEVSDSDTATTLGAALLAGMGIGLISNVATSENPHHHLCAAFFRPRNGGKTLKIDGYSRFSHRHVDEKNRHKSNGGGFRRLPCYENYRAHS